MRNINWTIDRPFNYIKYPGNILESGHNFLKHNTINMRTCDLNEPVI